MNAKNVFCTIDAAQPATRALVARAWANSATCALISMMATTVAREQRAIKRGETIDSRSEAANITGYSNNADEAQDDNDTDAPIGSDTKLTLNQLIEWTAAARAYSLTVAEGLDLGERRFAEPQNVKDSLEFMSTPRTSVTQDQIDAVLEEEPTLSRDDAVKLIQTMKIQDAVALAKNAPIIQARVNEALNDAPSDREMDTIFNELPENYRNTLVDKAIGSIEKELLRTLVLVIRGVPGISAKRKMLRSDLPALELLAA